MLGMWTRANRGQMAGIEKKTKRYPTDLTDEEWSRIAPLLPPPSKAGRTRDMDLRDPERDPLHSPVRRGMADAAQGYPALADGLLVVPGVCAPPAVPHHPRCGPDDRPRARRSGGEPYCRGHRQPVGQGFRCGQAWVRRGQEDQRLPSATLPWTRTGGC